MFVLATDLSMTVRQLLGSLDSYELAEWMAYYKIRSEKKEESPEVIGAKIKTGFPTHGKRRGLR